MTFAVPPPLPAETGSFCQGCMKLAPTKYVRFYRHIGAVILMFNQHTNGYLCRSCVNEHFVKTTLVTSFLGWWGMISCLLTPFFLFNNVVRYATCLSLKPPAEQTARGTTLAFITLAIAGTILCLLGYLLVSIIRS